MSLRFCNLREHVKRLSDGMGGSCGKQNARHVEGSTTARPCADVATPTTVAALSTPEKQEGKTKLDIATNDGTDESIVSSPLSSLTAPTSTQNTSTVMTDVSRQTSTDDSSALSVTECQQAEACFKMMDIDHGGSLSIQELTLSLKGILESAENVSLAKIMAIIDADCNDEISQEEWETYLTYKKAEMGQEMFSIFMSYVQVSAEESTRGVSQADDLSALIALRPGVGEEVHDSEQAAVVSMQAKLEKAKLSFPDPVPCLSSP